MMNRALTAFLTAMYGVLPFWTTWPIVNHLFAAAYAQSSMLSEAKDVPLVLTWVLAFALANLTIGLYSMGTELVWRGVQLASGRDSTGRAHSSGKVESLKQVVA